MVILYITEGKKNYYLKCKSNKDLKSGLKRMVDKI